MPQTFQLPKLSGQIRWSALKFGRTRSYKGRAWASSDHSGSGRGENSALPPSASAQAPDAFAKRWIKIVQLASSRSSREIMFPKRDTRRLRYQKPYPDVCGAIRPEELRC